MKLPTVPVATWRKVALVGAILVLALLLARLVSGYEAFRSELVLMDGVRIGESRDEVRYRLGPPPTVLGPAEPVIFDGKVAGLSQRAFAVDGPVGDQNTIPTGHSVNDFQSWTYTRDNLSTDLAVDFDKRGRVTRLTCTAHGDNPFACGPVAGLWNTDNEDKVLKLGKPSTNSVDGVTKTIEYDDIGVRYYLARGKAYSFSIYQTRAGAGALLYRYLRSFLPSKVSAL